MLLWIIVGVILVAIAVNLDSRRLAGKLAQHIREMDRLYEEFAERQIAGHILQHNDLSPDVSKIVENAVVLLKPHLNALIHQLNATYLSSIHIKYSSAHFPNIVGWCEQALGKKKENGKRVAPSDETVAFIALREALLADMQLRISTI